MERTITQPRNGFNATLKAKFVLEALREEAAERTVEMPPACTT